MDSPGHTQDRLMKLIQAKIRGTGTTLNTRWFALHKQITAVCIQNDGARERFLRSLHSINPARESPDEELFSSEPRLVRAKGHLHRIMPHKRTVALGIYSTPPGVVKELGQISHHLYEADRIEVGRRLDFSRWMNFVEIASTTRWSEIASEVMRLLNKQNSSFKDFQGPEIIKRLQPTDRIRAQEKSELLNILDNLPAVVKEKEDNRIENLRNEITRVDHFHQARQLVYTHLPTSYYIAPHKLLSQGNQKDRSRPLETDIEQHFSDFLRPAVKALTQNVIRALGRAREFGVPAILLIESLEKHTDARNFELLKPLLERMAQFAQVIYTTGKMPLFQNISNQLPYTEQELTADVRQEVQVLV